MRRTFAAPPTPQSQARNHQTPQFSRSRYSQRDDEPSQHDNEPSQRDDEPGQRDDEPGQRDEEPAGQRSNVNRRSRLREYRSPSLEYAEVESQQHSRSGRRQSQGRGPVSGEFHSTGYDCPCLMQLLNRT